MNSGLWEETEFTPDGPRDETIALGPCWGNTVETVVSDIVTAGVLTVPKAEGTRGWRTVPPDPL